MRMAGRFLPRPAACRNYALAFFCGIYRLGRATAFSPLPAGEKNDEQKKFYSLRNKKNAKTFAGYKRIATFATLYRPRWRNR